MTILVIWCESVPGTGTVLELQGDPEFIDLRLNGVGLLFCDLYFVVRAIKTESSSISMQC